jgi:hypothetical protein
MGSFPGPPPWLITVLEMAAVAGMLFGLILLVTGRTPRWLSRGRISAPRAVRLSGLADVLLGAALLDVLLMEPRFSFLGVPLALGAVLATLLAMRGETQPLRQTPPKA